jgi:ABC-type amino acid transport substrate-binding protein
MPALRASEPETKGSTGRVRHNEKITVYMSADELLDLEHARLMLRREYGVAVDRGRIVREALDIALAEITSDGSASPLVRRLAGAPLSTDPDQAAGAEPTTQ